MEMNPTTNMKLANTVKSFFIITPFFPINMRPRGNDIKGKPEPHPLSPQSFLITIKPGSLISIHYQPFSGRAKGTKKGIRIQASDHSKVPNSSLCRVTRSPGCNGPTPDGVPVNIKSPSWSAQMLLK